MAAVLASLLVLVVLLLVALLYVKCRLNVLLWYQDTYGEVEMNGMWRSSAGFRAQDSAKGLAACRIQSWVEGVVALEGSKCTKPVERQCLRRAQDWGQPMEEMCSEKCWAWSRGVSITGHADWLSLQMGSYTMRTCLIATAQRTANL